MDSQSTKTELASANVQIGKAKEMGAPMLEIATAIGGGLLADHLIAKHLPLTNNIVAKAMAVGTALSAAVGAHYLVPRTARVCNAEIHSNYLSKILGSRDEENSLPRKQPEIG